MNICVYASSSDRLNSSYIAAAEHFGESLANRGHIMVYGAGSQGLMGAAATGVTRAGGKVIGVAPRFFLPDGVLNEHCTEMIYTETMRERKAIMAERADAIAALPGSIGTFEEFFETLTLKQLCRHAKPMAILNTNGYYEPMLQMLRHAVDEDFMSERSIALFEVFDDADRLLDYLEQSITSGETSEQTSGIIVK